MIKTFLRICTYLISKILKIDDISDKFSISIKAIIIEEEKVLCLKNERNEWDLPGGKTSYGEISEDCLIREVKEETNLVINDLNIHKPLNVKFNDVQVFILTYTAKISCHNNITTSFEHTDYNFFSKSEIKQLNMPLCYKNLLLDLL